MTTLVTGGAGAIGSNLVRHLLQLNHSVVVVDDLSSGYADNLPHSATFIHGDITDDVTLNSLFHKYRFEYIFHLAALFANQNSVEHPVRDLSVNGLGTLRLLEKAQQLYSQKTLKRFVYSSSSCVYGTFSGTASEEMKLAPDTPYAITKLMGEYYCDFFHKNYLLPTTVFRFFNSYGPGERPGKYRNVIPNFIHRAMKHEPLVITGTGNETRDFTYVDDAIRCLTDSLNLEPSIGKTYNIATGQETKIIDLAKKIILYTGSKSTIEFAPRRSWDHTLTRCGNIAKAGTDIRYNPNTSLDDGLRTTVEWFRKIQQMN